MRRAGSWEVVAALEEIADLLEISGADPFKVRAYRRAARSIRGMPEDLSRLDDDNALESIPGVGKALAAKIREILDTGTSKYLESLRKEVPPSLRSLLGIPGLGAKTAGTLYRELGVRDLDMLEVAVDRGLVRSIPKIGPKKEAEIRRGLERLRSMAKVIPIGVALPFAEEMVGWLRGQRYVENAEAAGEVRRFLPVVEVIVMVCGTRYPKAVIEMFLRSPYVRDVIYRHEDECKVETTRGCVARLVAVEPSSFGVAMNLLTGSEEHISELERLASNRGLEFSGFSLKSKDTGQIEAIPREEALYGRLGLPFVPPELREGTGEVESALRGELPELIQQADIKGDLHVHTSWSDGIASLEILARSAKELGYEYIAVTDHSKSLSVARGLNADRLREQGEAIRALNEELGGFRILSGIEVEIMKDGSLDLPDDVLRGLDVVVASIHTGFRAEKPNNTERLLTAMKNENIDIIAHPTGRMIGYRSGYELDLDAILSYAGRTGTVLEINACPDRLDLDYVAAREAALKYGAKLAVNTDAHSIGSLKDMRYGVGMARKAGLSKEDIVNTRSISELKKVLKKGFNVR